MPALLLYVVKQLELVSRARLDALLKPSGVTALQYTALSVLERRPTMSSSDLARASFVRAQSTADLVQALERRGLIERSVDPANRRRLLISLTEKGYAFLEEYDPLVADLEEEMVKDLTAEERDVFRRYLVAGRRALSGEH
jgi:DNA-binding MarR family transcriptional regulator